MCIEHDLPALVLFALLILGAVQKKRQVNLETFIFRANLFEEIDKKGGEHLWNFICVVLDFGG